MKTNAQLQDELKGLTEITKRQSKLIEDQQKEINILKGITQQHNAVMGELKKLKEDLR